MKSNKATPFLHAGLMPRTGVAGEIQQGIKWTDRLTGAILNSAAAAIGMAQVVLVFVIWAAWFSLLLGFAIIKGILKAKR